jgi:hypothetical protein
VLERVRLTSPGPFLEENVKYFRQCNLKKDNQYQTAWLEEKPGLREGSMVELKSETESDKKNWEVVQMGARVDQDFLNNHRGWNVGGLGETA